MLGKLFCIQYLCISIYYSSLRIFKVCAIQKMGFIKLSTDGIFYPSYCLYRIPSYCTCKVSKVLIESNENIPLFRWYLYFNYLVNFTNTNCFLNRFFQQLFELLIPPVQEFRYILLGFAALNILACVLLEDFIVEVLFQRGAQK